MAIFLNILYGLIIGLTIALGSGFISRKIFKSDKLYENPTRYFMIAILSIMLYIIVSIVIVNYLWFKITQGISFSELLQRSFAFYMLGSQLILGLVIYLIILSSKFVNDLNQYYKRIAEMEMQLSTYRYDTLKNQLNPHFLFNALNTLSGLIYIDADKADEFTHRLSKLYRYVLDVQKEEVVLLERELNLANDFLYLNNIRFNNQINTTFSIQDKEVYVVPMALQLLLENVIKHNSVNEKHPIHIDISTDDNFLIVKNSVRLKTEKEPSHELGLNNLRELYALLSNQSISIENSDTHFTVKLPLLKKENK
jgi:sensor histidine kinase YesM